jgi:hypothetical protein
MIWRLKPEKEPVWQRVPGPTRAAPKSKNAAPPRLTGIGDESTLKWSSTWPIFGNRGGAIPGNRSGSIV